MKLEFHYEVETVFDQKKEKVTINSFDNEDPLISRKDAFSFLRNYINILKHEGQVIVKTKESSVRNQAQFRYDSRTPNFEHNLQACFVSHLIFKDQRLNNGLKIYLVVDKSNHENIKNDERLLIYQLGNYTKQSLDEMLNGLVKEYYIHSIIDTCIHRNTQEIDISAFWYFINKESLESRIISILKTPIHFDSSYFGKLFSVFNPKKIFPFKLIKDHYVGYYEDDFIKLENFDFKDVFKDASSLFYTSGGLLALKIDSLNGEKEATQLLTEFNTFFTNMYFYKALKNIEYKVVNCKNKKGELFLCLLIEHYTTKDHFTPKIPTKLYYRKNGYRECITDVNEILIYLNQNL
ncbi:hypothetical protein [Chishuiella sp.]|uniref:hypothetical protein n=1 Tax=Chishuiella sp. TaxID=1969467 RepID=UPI0028AFEA5F|nr:hypothetical protein [Chishuiella sp.]